MHSEGKLCSQPKSVGDVKVRHSTAQVLYQQLVMVVVASCSLSVTVTLQKVDVL